MYSTSNIKDKIKNNPKNIKEIDLDENHPDDNDENKKEKNI